MPEAIRGVNTTAPVSAANAAGQTGNTKTVEAEAASSASTSGVDSADVAQTEALLQTIVKAASDVPGIDQEKVAALQQAISSGAYQANPQAIAAQLVELEALLNAAGSAQ